MKKIAAGIIPIIFACSAFGQSSLESGNTKYNAGDYEGAVIDYFQATDENPEDEKAWYNLGMAQEKLENSDGAIEYFTKAIELNPLFAKAWASRGLSNEHNGDDDEALADYSKAFEIDPSLINALYQKVSLQLQMELYDDAIAALTNYIDAGGEKPANVYYLRAVANNRAQHYSANTLEDLEKAAALGKKDKFVIYEVGTWYYIKGEWDKAIEAFSKVIEKDPEYFKAWHKRGLCKIPNGDKTGGCEDLHKADELGSEDAKDDIKEHCQ